MDTRDSPEVFTGTADAALADLQRRPIVIHRPNHPTVPFVFASPHSGRCYPDSFARRTTLSPTMLRQSEDAFIDDLFAIVVEAGAPLIAARFPRAFVDVNRSPRELDPHMFEGRLAVPAESGGAHVAMGLGVIPRVVREGVEIYGGKIAASEVNARMTEFYEPYHTALAGLIAETVTRFGMAILIDCHSMPSGEKIPDIVIGDRFGVSAMPALTHLAERVFARQGFTVARNAPYAGGYTTQFYGRRNGPVQALQIELNRSLYLDEARVTRSSHFGMTAQRLASAVGELIAADRSQFFAPAVSPIAAE